MCKCPYTYYITVIEDTTTGEVVGTGTLLMEQKFIRNCAVVSLIISYTYLT